MRTDLDRLAALAFINELRAEHSLEPIDTPRRWAGCLHPLRASLAPLRVRLAHHVIYVNQPGRIRSWALPPDVARFVDACWQAVWPDLGSIADGECPLDAHHVDCPDSLTQQLRRRA